MPFVTMTGNLARARGRLAFVVSSALMSGAVLGVWQRALDAVAGRTAYSLLACVGVSAAAGVAGWLFADWPTRRVRENSFAVLCGAFLLGAVGFVLLPFAVPRVLHLWDRLLTDPSRTFVLYLKTLGATAACFLVLPASVFGATARSAFPRDRWRGGVSGLAAGIVSAALGYGASGWLVSIAGVESLTRGAALWFAALTALAIVLDGGRRGALRWAAACVPVLGVAAALIFLCSDGKVSVLCDGVFARFVHRDSGFAYGKPAFVHHTRTHSVAAYADSDYQFVFALDGRPVLFGSRFHTARTLSGYVPLLVRPACRKAAVVGAEAGLYLPFFVRAGVKELAYGRSDPDVVKLAVAADAYVTGDDACEKAVFHRWESPSPTDAFDVLFLTPEPSWLRGTGAAYGRRWFARCCKSLADDGIVALHVDARALPPDRFAAIASDFSAVFPGVQVWCTGANDWVLVGGGRELKTPVDHLLTLFERTAVFRDFVRAGGLALPEALACMLCDGKGLEPWLARTKKESAFRAAWTEPFRLFAKERDSLSPAALEGCRQWKAQWILPGEADLDMYFALLDKVGRMKGARVAVVSALSDVAKGRPDAGLDALRRAAAIDPHDALLICRAETLELEGRRRMNLGDLKGALKCFEILLSFSPGTAFSNYGMALCLRGNGDNEGAYLHFSRAVAYAPEQVNYRLEMAQSALDVGKYSEADRQYREALKRDPDNPAVLFLSAKALVCRDRPQKDGAQAVQLAKRACVLTQWKKRDYVYGLADIYIEAGRVLEGMGLKRRLKEGKFEPKSPVIP